MRSLRIFIFSIMLLFCANLFVSSTVFAAGEPDARKVTKVEFNKGAVQPGASSTKGWTGQKVAGAIAGAATTAAILTGVAVATGGIGLLAVGIGAALGWGVFKTIAPEECSFNDILKSFYGMSDGSWFSPVFNTLFNSINELVVRVNNNLGGSVVTILGLLLAFYILFTVTKAVVSFSPIEPSKLFSDIFFPVGRCILAVWAIKYWQVIFTEIISPLLNLGITFGNEIISKVQSTGSYSATLSGGVEYMTASCTVVGDSGLDKSICDSIQTFLATVSMNLLVWMAFGATMMADCWAKGWMNILPSFEMFFMGLILFVFAFMVYISFPLKLIDALFRLMFVVVLFPLWCAFWVVPQTRKYSANAFNMFLNVLATFLSASVVLVMVISILGSLFDGLNMNEIVKLLQEGKGEAAMKKIDFSTSGLFYSVCLLFMCSHLVSKVDYFANIFVKQDSMGIGGAVSGAATTAIASSPKVLKIADSGLKAGIGKSKQIAGGIANRSRAKSYNENVPGGTARQGPRLWSANPKNAIGSYQKTGDVVAGKVQKAADGSTSQTYSNATYDKDKNLMARMKETTTSNADKSKQSVNRERTKFDENGNVSRTANVKKDFENGQAVRKTTTMKDKDGNRVDISVDKNTGLATKTKYAPDGRKLSTETRARGGERTLETYKPDGTVEKSVKDSDGIERSKSITRTDGSKETFRYSKDRMPDGRAVQFENMSKDASGAVTRHLRVNVASDTYTDVLTGRSGQWSTYGRGP